MLVLSVNNIVRQFDAAPVLDGVTFEICSGEKVGFVGPNGAGKTTLMKILAGLDEPDSGECILHAAAQTIAVETDPQARQKLQRRYDSLQQELHRHSAYNIDHRVDEVLFGLGFNSDQYERPISQFSGGQQNRVLLARLLL